METARLRLEPLRAAHAALLYPGLGDPALYRYIGKPAPASVAALEESFRARERGGPPDGSERWLNWAALKKADAAYVGRFEATLRRDRTAEIGYIILTPYMRKGFAREGCPAVIDHLFGEHDVLTVVATVDARNEASWRLVETLGMTRVATAGGDYRYELARA